MSNSGLTGNTSPRQPAVLTYPARLHKPLLMHAFSTEDPNRTAPGGSIIEVVENLRIPRQLTAMVTMDGVIYARDLQVDGSQFTRLP